MWWLAEADGRAVSSAGIFWDADGKLARFQSVDTRPEARGNGFCTGLLNAMVLDIQQRLPQLETCVIVAEVGAQAERIYRRVGFEPAGRQMRCGATCPVTEIQPLLTAFRARRPHGTVALGGAESRLGRATPSTGPGGGRGRARLSRPPTRSPHSDDWPTRSGPVGYVSKRFDVQPQSTNG